MHLKRLGRFSLLRQLFINSYEWRSASPSADTATSIIMAKSKKEKCETKLVGFLCLIKIHILGLQSTCYDSWTHSFTGRCSSNCSQPTGKLICCQKGNHLSNLLAGRAMRASRNKIGREKRGQVWLYLVM